MVRNFAQSGGGALCVSLKGGWSEMSPDAQMSWHGMSRACLVGELCPAEMQPRTRCSDTQQVSLYSVSPYSGPQRTLRVSRMPHECRVTLGRRAATCGASSRVTRSQWQTAGMARSVRRGPSYSKMEYNGTNSGLHNARCRGPAVCLIYT